MQLQAPTQGQRERQGKNIGSAGRKKSEEYDLNQAYKILSESCINCGLSNVGTADVSFSHNFL